MGVSPAAPPHAGRITAVPSPTLAQKAERLLALHRVDKPLVLVNTWDAVSARILEQLGYPAIATTSAGLAYTRGFPDGQHISRAVMLQEVENIASAVELPVTADLEAAYGLEESDAVAAARGVIDAGAVGLNFEDAGERGTVVPMEQHARRIAVMRHAADELHVPLVINARTDVFLEGIGDSDAWRLAEAIQRGSAYLNAGADCFFVPGVSDEFSIATLVKEVPGPVNILATAKTPQLARLRELGVSRVSLGSGPIGYALAALRETAAQILKDGRFDFLSGRISHADLNALFDGRS